MKSQVVSQALLATFIILLSNKQPYGYGIFLPTAPPLTPSLHTSCPKENNYDPAFVVNLLLWLYSCINSIFSVRHSDGSCATACFTARYHSSLNKPDMHGQ